MDEKEPHHAGVVTVTPLYFKPYDAVVLINDQLTKYEFISIDGRTMKSKVKNTSNGEIAEISSTFIKPQNWFKVMKDFFGSIGNESEEKAQDSSGNDLNVIVSPINFSVSLALLGFKYDSMHLKGLIESLMDKSNNIDFNKYMDWICGRNNVRIDAGYVLPTIESVTGIRPWNTYTNYYQFKAANSDETPMVLNSSCVFTNNRDFVSLKDSFNKHHRVPATLKHFQSLFKSKQMVPYLLFGADSSIGGAAIFDLYPKDWKRSIEKLYQNNIYFWSDDVNNGRFDPIYDGDMVTDTKTWDSGSYWDSEIQKIINQTVWIQGCQFPDPFISIDDSEWADPRREPEDKFADEQHLGQHKRQICTSHEEVEFWNKIALLLYCRSWYYQYSNGKTAINIGNVDNDYNEMISSLYNGSQFERLAHLALQVYGYNADAQNPQPFWNIEKNKDVYRSVFEEYMGGKETMVMFINKLSDDPSMVHMIQCAFKKLKILGTSDDKIQELYDAWIQAGMSEFDFGSFPVPANLDFATPYVPIPSEPNVSGLYTEVYKKKPQWADAYFNSTSLTVLSFVMRDHKFAIFGNNYKDLDYMKGDTLIMMSNMQSKLICQIRIGDKILTPYGSLSIKSRNQIQKKRITKTKMYGFEDGSEYFSITQPFYAHNKGNWYSISNGLYIGDYVCFNTNEGVQRMKIQNIVSKTCNNQLMFKLNIDSSFYANGILTKSITKNDNIQYDTSIPMVSYRPSSIDNMATEFHIENVKLESKSDDMDMKQQESSWKPCINVGKYYIKSVRFNYGDVYINDKYVKQTNKEENTANESMIRWETTDSKFKGILNINNNHMTLDGSLWQSDEKSESLQLIQSFEATKSFDFHTKGSLKVFPWHSDAVQAAHDVDYSDFEDNIDITFGYRITDSGVILGTLEMDGITIKSGDGLDVTTNDDGLISVKTDQMYLNDKFAKQIENAPSKFPLQCEFTIYPSYDQQNKVNYHTFIGYFQEFESVTIEELDYTITQPKPSAFHTFIGSSQPFTNNNTLAMIDYSPISSQSISLHEKLNLNREMYDDLIVDDDLSINAFNANLNIPNLLACCNPWNEQSIQKRIKDAMDSAMLNQMPEDYRTQFYPNQTPLPLDTEYKNFIDQTPTVQVFFEYFWRVSLAYKLNETSKDDGGFSTNLSLNDKQKLQNFMNYGGMTKLDGYNDNHDFLYKYCVFQEYSELKEYYDDSSNDWAQSLHTFVTDKDWIRSKASEFVSNVSNNQAPGAKIVQLLQQVNTLLILLDKDKDKSGNPTYTYTYSDDFNHQFAFAVFSKQIEDNGELYLDEDTTKECFDYIIKDDQWNTLDAETQSNLDDLKNIFDYAKTVGIDVVKLANAFFKVCDQAKKKKDNANAALSAQGKQKVNFDWDAQKGFVEDGMEDDAQFKALKENIEKESAKDSTAWTKIKAKGLNVWNKLKPFLGGATVLYGISEIILASTGQLDGPHRADAILSGMKMVSSGLEKLEGTIDKFFSSGEVAEMVIKPFKWLSQKIFGSTAKLLGVAAKNVSEIAKDTLTETLLANFFRTSMISTVTRCVGAAAAVAGCIVAWIGFAKVMKDPNADIVDKALSGIGATIATMAALVAIGALFIDSVVLSALGAVLVLAGIIVGLIQIFKPKKSPADKYYDSFMGWFGTHTSEIYFTNIDFDDDDKEGISEFQTEINSLPGPSF